MAISNLWQGRTGRLLYLVGLIISSAAIAVLPFVAGKIIAATVAGGPDPALAILRSLLYPIVIGIGLFIAGGPLVVIARRRLRELGISGVWLLLFPIGPLWTLLLFVVANRSLMVWPLPVTAPVMTPLFWIEFAFGALLVVLPSREYLAHSTNPILRFAHRATTCEGRINRQVFAVHLAIAFGLTMALQIFTPLSAGAFAWPGARFSPMVASAIGSASGLLGVFVQMFLTASTIRRLHDLNQRGWWIILFPFGLVSLTFFFALVPMLANPQLLATMLFNPLLMVTSVQGLGCLILLVRLLLTGGRDPDNVYGPLVIPPASSYLPA
jgi:uncharacterized membrane protein YhaH (DUF805 family)